MVRMPQPLAADRAASTQSDEWLDRSPLSPEERERGRQALDRLLTFRDELLAERGGRPFEPAWQAVAEARAALDDGTE